VTGCTSFTSDASAPIAIEFVTSQAPPLRLEELDTIVVGVRVRNRAGDTIPGVSVRLASLNPDTVAIDSADLGLIGLRPGPAKVVAFAGSLASDPLLVSVVRAPDSLALVGPSPDTAFATDTASDSLKAALLDLRTNPAQPTALGSGYLVTFSIAYPVFADLTAATVTLGNDSLSQVTKTGPAGTAAVIVRRQGPPPQPDSVVVEASATRAVGTAVAGSPVRFIVRFQ
jgi:hypothetical protein